jgi:cytochrome b
MSTTDGNVENQLKDVMVWDLGVRLFHWLLVSTVAVAIVTGFFAGKPWLDAHVISGVCIVALVVFRVIWGFLGSTYARFGSFVVSPGAAVRHLRDAASGGRRRSLGHNPLGAWMILTLLAALTVICALGAVALGGVVKEGPFAPHVTYAFARQAKEIHEFLAYLLVGLIALHILGAFFESWRSSENLSRGMVTGRKRRSSDARTCAPVRGRPVIAGILFAGAAAAAAQVVVRHSALPAYKTPAGPLDATYAKECGACHSPHHPSLAPAGTWKKIMSGLDDHFGDNASLTPELTRRLTAYLTLNAAGAWDTRPAHAFRTADPREPLRITATRIWKRIHRKIPDETFKSKPVGGKLNCSNCHGDAETGRFAPRAIAIKRETTK